MSGSGLQGGFLGSMNRSTMGPMGGFYNPLASELYSPSSIFGPSPFNQFANFGINASGPLYAGMNPMFIGMPAFFGTSSGGFERFMSGGMWGIRQRHPGNSSGGWPFGGGSFGRSIFQTGQKVGSLVEGTHLLDTPRGILHAYDMLEDRFGSGRRASAGDSPGGLPPRLDPPGTIRERALEYYGAAEGRVALQDFLKMRTGSNDYWRSITKFPDRDPETGEIDPADLAEYESRKEEKTREVFLYNFAKFLTERLKGPEGNQYMALLLKRYEELKSSGQLTPEKMLLALVDPEHELSADVSAAALRLMLPQGMRASGVPADQFDTFLAQLEKQLGSEWQDIVSDLFYKQVLEAQDVGPSGETPVDRTAFVQRLQTELNFTPGEAEAFADRVLKKIWFKFQEDKIFRELADKKMRLTQGGDINDPTYKAIREWYLSEFLGKGGAELTGYLTEIARLDDKEGKKVGQHHRPVGLIKFLEKCDQMIR